MTTPTPAGAPTPPTGWARSGSPPPASWRRSEPFVAEGHEPLLAALDGAATDVIGRPFEPVGLNAWADAALMQAAGIPTVMIGSAGGNFHAPDEWASISELAQLARIVEGAARTFCGIDE